MWIDDPDMRPIEAQRLAHIAVYNVISEPTAVLRAGISIEGLSIGMPVVGKSWPGPVVLAVAT